MKIEINENEFIEQTEVTLLSTDMTIDTVKYMNYGLTIAYKFICENDVKIDAIKFYTTYGKLNDKKVTLKLWIYDIDNFALNIEVE